MNSICMKIYIKYLKLKLAEVCISLRKFEDLQNYIRKLYTKFLQEFDTNLYEKFEKVCKI